VKLNINISKLRTVKHFATDNKVTTAYIYKLMSEGKIKPVEIDGVKFVDLSTNPTLHGK